MNRREMRSCIRLGKDYGYPGCCIYTFVLRTYLWYPVLLFLVKRRVLTTVLYHKTNPGVKCAYHWTKSVLGGDAKFIKLEDQVCNDCKRG